MICFEIWKSSDYKKVERRNELYKQMKNMYINNKDKERVYNILKPFFIIDENGYGSFDYCPWHNKEDLKYYFNVYKHYFKEIPEEVYDHLLKIYSKYPNDIGPLFKEWYNSFDIKPVYEECLNLKIDFKILKEKKLLINLINNLKKLKSKIENPYYEFSKEIEDDLKKLNIIKKYLEKNYIIKNELL